MARANRVRSGDARRCKRCMGNRSAAKESIHILRQLKKFSATASRISLYGTCSGDWCCGRRSPGPVHTALLSCCYPYGHPGCCHRSSPALPPGQVESPILTGQGISAMSVRNFLLGFWAVKSWLIRFSALLCQLQRPWSILLCILFSHIKFFFDVVICPFIFVFSFYDSTP